MAVKLASGQSAPAELFIWTDIDPQHDKDFNQWYEQEHMLERVRIPGFVWARRYRAVQAERQYLALYRTQQLAVFNSAAYQQAFQHQTQWSLQNFERMQNTMRRVMTSTLFGAAVGTGAALALVALSTTEQAIQAAQWGLEHAADLQSVVSMRVLLPDPQLSTPLPSEPTEGRVLQPFFVLEATDTQAVQQAAQQLGQSLGLSAQAISVFQLLWELRAADLPTEAADS